MGTKAPKSGYKPPPEMQRAMQMRLSMVSSNLLAEPFRGVPPSQPVTAYFTIGGWKQVWRRFLAHAKSLYTLAKTKKAIPGFSKDQFKGEALTLYKQVCGLLAAGDKTELRQLVTPAVFSDVKRQLKQREDGGWARVHWEITQEPTARELTVMQGRLIMIDPKDDTTGFSQLTVRVPSKQRFAAFNAVGKLVAGSLEQEIDVEDYWVFEHSMKPAATNRWRLAGRLSILPHAVEQRQQPAGAQQQGSDAAAQQQQQQQQQQKQQPAAEGAITARMGHIAEQQQQQQHSGKPARRRATAGRGRR
ncbi:39S ribosomal mitochondrial [Micractinium conductrix]|uniref:Large ribosomal subunit protein mL45 n=1 Tax=Micractinium conductrix TaxID=554055 RepID=A0A2P6VPE6_9CHLO|nr:39S ribosomal mitochondrial [Micractinium conductrix]|eukprot:PSC75974.1 39S ribosomal mitochondrial [Micractinium conductrix]